jgi:hypothetical protein
MQLRNPPSADSATNAPQPAGDLCDDTHCVDLVGRCPIGQVVAAADDTDGGDANAAFHFG